MLSQACHRFREELTADGEHSHAEHCSACRAWADVVTGLRQARLDRPLPEGLYSRLLSTPRTGSQGIEPLPQLPLPHSLQRRLIKIPDRQVKVPASWLLKVRYGVAASLLLTFVSVSALGSTVSRGHQSAQSWSQRVDQSLRAAKIMGREALTALGTTAAEAYEKARDTTLDAPDQISSGWTGLSALVIELVRDSEHRNHQKEIHNGNNPDSSRTE
jgi:hypothetical protein